MSTQENVRIAKAFFAAMAGDRQGLLALTADDIEWIIPGEHWPLAGTHRGHAGLTNLLKTVSETVETSFLEPREFIAQGDRVLVVGFARGKIKATDKMWVDDWVFAMTIRDGKLANIREYVDTQALARASQMDARSRSTTSIAKALTVFQGIGNRDQDLAIKYMHPTNFTQHNPLVSDGIDGVKEWIRRLPREKSPLKTVRAFRDGSYVIANTEGDIFGQNVFFDILRLEDDLIVEQWTFSTKAAPPNKSGHTQTDGPTEAKHEQDTEKNKSIVRDYYETVHLSGDHGKIPNYSADYCIRHEPGVSDGLAAFLRDLKAATEHGKASRSIEEIKLVLGQGDFVFVAAKGTVKGAPCAYIDLYRVEGDKMAEHWGFHEEIPPPEQRRNTNGVV